MKCLVTRCLIILGLLFSLAQSDSAFALQQEPSFPESNATSQQLLIKAKKGDAMAQYQLGELYHHGKGIRQNFEKAEQWTMAAANQGLLDAQFCLGELYLFGVGVPDWLKQVIVGNLSKDKTFSPLRLEGNLLYWSKVGRDDYKPPNAQQGVYWLTKAATRGHRQAQYDLGQWYGGLLVRKGGPEQDSSKALPWLKKATEQGHPLAPYGIGLHYLDKTEAFWKLEPSPENKSKENAYAEKAFFWLALASKNPDFHEAQQEKKNLEQRLTPESITKVKEQVAHWVPKTTIKTKCNGSKSL